MLLLRVIIVTALWPLGQASVATAWGGAVAEGPAQRARCAPSWFSPCGCAVYPARPEAWASRRRRLITCVLDPPGAAAEEALDSAEDFEEQLYFGAAAEGLLHPLRPHRGHGGGVGDQLECGLVLSYDRAFSSARPEMAYGWHVAEGTGGDGTRRSVLASGGPRCGYTHVCRLPLHYIGARCIGLGWAATDGEGPALHPDERGADTRLPPEAPHHRREAVSSRRGRGRLITCPGEGLIPKRRAEEDGEEEQARRREGEGAGYPVCRMIALAGSKRYIVHDMDFHFPIFLGSSVFMRGRGRPGRGEWRDSRRPGCYFARRLCVGFDCHGHGRRRRWKDRRCGKRVCARLCANVDPTTAVEPAVERKCNGEDMEEGCWRCSMSAANRVWRTNASHPQDEKECDPGWRIDEGGSEMVMGRRDCGRRHWVRRKGESGRKGNVSGSRARELNGTRDAPSASHAREHVSRRPTHGLDCGTCTHWNWTIHHTLQPHATSLIDTDGDGFPRPRMNTKPLPQPSPPSWGPSGGGGPEVEDLTARDLGPRGWSADYGKGAMTVDGCGDDEGTHESGEGGCGKNETERGEGVVSSGVKMGGTVILSRAAPVMPLGLRKGGRSWSTVGALWLAFLATVGIPTFVFAYGSEDQVTSKDRGYSKGTDGGKRGGARAKRGSRRRKDELDKDPKGPRKRPVPDGCERPDARGAQKGGRTCDFPPCRESERPRGRWQESSPECEEGEGMNGGRLRVNSDRRRCRWVGGRRRAGHRRRTLRWSGGGGARGRGGLYGARRIKTWRKSRALSTRTNQSDGWPRDILIGEPGAVRYGEATHPGPPEENEELPLGLRPESDDVCYPQAHRDGFRAIRTAGFEDRRSGGQKAEQQFSLRLETANTTGWGALKKLLGQTEAHVVFAQETRVRARDVPLASSWALRNGWKSLWSPAVRGKRGGASAGVAVFAKEWIGMRAPPKGGHEIHGGRAVASVIDAPGYRPFLAVSVYGHVNKGAGTENAELLRAIGRRIDCQGDGWQYVIAGDYNLTPEQMAGAGFAEMLGGVIVKPDTARGTCRTPRAARVLDFFVMSDAMSMAVHRVTTVETSGIKTHVPVQAEMFPRAAAMKALYIRPPPKIPTERVYGPLPPPGDWREAKAAAERAVQMARTAGRNRAEQELDKAYKVWADAAETELCDVTGTKLPKMGLRGLRPNAVWRSVMPEKAPKEQYPRASVATTLASALQELIRLLGGGGDDEADDPGAHGGEDEAPAAGDADEDAGGDGGGGGVGEGFGDDEVDDPHAAAREIDEALRSMPVPPVEDEELARWLDVVRRAAGDARDLLEATAGRGTDGGSGDDDLRTCLMAMRDELKDIQEKWRREDEKDAKRRWEEWLLEGFDRGARNAHRFSRNPLEWVPTETRAVEESPIVSSDPVELQEEQRRKYRDKWDAAPGPLRYDWHDRDALPRLSCEAVREASLSHKPATAETFDGFHPRHYAMLSDEGRSVVAAIMEASELLGTVPGQLRLANMPLIAKPKGGYRGIGVLPSLYRVWARARRSEADAWERDNKRAYWSAAKGNSAVDTVWRQAAKQEAGIACGKEAAGLIYDLESFYELIDRKKLWKRAQKAGFPMPILRMCLGMYAAPRVITMRGRASRQLHPRRGIIAGCPIATTLVMVFCIDPLDRLVAELPRSTALDAHIDDFVLAGIETANNLVTDMKEAEHLLRRTLNRELGGTISMGKAGLVASRKDILTALREAIPGMDIEQTVDVVNLGSDFAAGRRRRCIRGTSRLGRRMRSARSRRRRLEIIARVAGRRGMRIFTTGIAPSGTFGAAVSGLDDGDVLALRRVAAAGMSPRGRGRALAIVHLLNGVPTAQFEVAPILQLSRMIWKGQFEREEAARRGSGLAELAGMWYQASDYFLPMAERVRAEAMGERPIGRARASREAWRNSRGPLCAAALSFARVGWSYGSPFTVTTDEGADIDLTATAPSLVKSQLEAAVKRSMEREVGRSWAKRADEYQGRRVCLDLAVKALRGAGAGGKLERGAFRSALCGAAMTMSRAFSLGYEVDNLCPLCGEQGDTVRHRTYFCRCTEEAVQAAVPKWFIEEAVRASPMDRFWTTGAFPHPAEVAPPLASDMNIVVEHGERDDDGECAGDEGAVDGAVTDIGGRVYLDGSCQPSAIDGMSRAGACVVQVNAEGAMVKKLTCAVPRHLPQTSQVAEHLAAVLAIRCLAREAEMFGDCLGVVKALNDAGAPASFAKKRYGGLLLDTARDPARRALCRSLRWVKSHRCESATDSVEERIHIKGNNLADKGAAEAVAQHPALGTELRTAVDFWEKRASLVIKAVGAAMAAFPPAPGDMKKRSRENGSSSRDQDAEHADRQHTWVFDEGAWRCERCWSWRTRKQGSRGRSSAICEGASRCADLGRFVKNGHKMAWADGPLPFAFCTRCGAWASRRPRKLLKSCGEPTANGRLALNRIARGLHPWQRREADGSMRPRATIRVRTRTDAGLEDAPTYKGKRRCMRRGGEQPQEEPEDARRNDVDDLADQGRAAAGEPPEDEIIIDDCMQIDGDGGAGRDEHCGQHPWEEEDFDVFGHGGSLDGEHEGDSRGKRKRCEEVLEFVAGSVVPARQPCRQRDGLPVHRRDGMDGHDQADERGGGADKWVPRMPGSSTDGMAYGGRRAELSVRNCMDARPGNIGEAPRMMESNDTARAKGIAQYAVDACEAPGGPCDAGATEAVAPPIRAAVTASVTAEQVAARPQCTDDYAREAVADRGEAAVGPPSGYAVPLAGRKQVTGNQRPEWKSPQGRPKSLGVGPSKGPEVCDDDGDGPANREYVRRRDGVDAPSCSAAAARSGADAAVRSRREEPLKGSIPSDKGARKECLRPVMATGRAVKRRRIEEVQAGDGAVAREEEARDRPSGGDDVPGDERRRVEEALLHGRDPPRRARGSHRHEWQHRDARPHRRGPPQEEGLRQDARLRREPRCLRQAPGELLDRARKGDDEGHVEAAGKGDRSGAWVLPWERPPSWLYLPHQLEQRAEEQGGDADNVAAPQVGEEAKDEDAKRLIQHRRDEGNVRNPRPASINKQVRLGDVGGRRSIQRHDVGEAAGLEHCEPADPRGAIRGHDGLPGTCGGSVRANAMQRVLIRGQNVLPGASSARDQPTSDASGSRGSTTEVRAASGTGMGLRARCKVVASRQGDASSIAWHLEDHAERVAAKRSRLGNQPPPISPAERLAALRARIASRKPSCDAAPRSGDACASAATATADHGNGAR